MFDIETQNSFTRYIDLLAAAEKEKFYINFSYMNNANIEDILKRVY